MRKDNDAIIFDIDGTLWNACPASAKGWNVGFAKLSIDKEVTSQQIESVSGNTYEKCVEILFPGLQEQYPKLLGTLEKFEIEIVKSDGGTFYDGVIDGIKKLACSYHIFLVSNCQKWYMDLFLNSSGIKPMLTDFDCYGMSHLTKGEMLSNIKRNYSLNSPVYVGDTEADRNAADFASIKFLLVSYGFGSINNNIFNFDSFSALLNYVGVY